MGRKENIVILTEDEVLKKKEMIEGKITEYIYDLLNKATDEKKKQLLRNMIDRCRQELKKFENPTEGENV